MTNTSRYRQKVFVTAAKMVLIMCGLLPCGCIATTIHSDKADKADVKGLQIIVEARDGSRMAGITMTDAVPLRTTALGKIKIPLSLVRIIAMHEDRKQAIITFKNGDRLTGAPDCSGLKLTTLVGEILADMTNLVTITVLGKLGVPEKGLLLWNSLGSEMEVQHSRIGPDGVFRGGSFTEGVDGQAFMANHDQNNMVAFPGEMVPVKAGCIEVWARLQDMPSNLRWGANPWLFVIDGFSVSLNGNDGNGKGGLCGSAGQLGFCATGNYGTWSYTQALDGNDPTKWHHYALVWDKAGIKGIGDGNHTVAVFLDGRLNTRSWSELMPNTVEPVPLSQGELVLMADQHLNQGRVTLDELKIWSYAKTDFQESLRARSDK